MSMSGTWYSAYCSVISLPMGSICSSSSSVFEKTRPIFANAWCCCAVDLDSNSVFVRVL